MYTGIERRKCDTSLQNAVLNWTSINLYNQFNHHHLCRLPEAEQVLVTDDAGVDDDDQDALIDRNFAESAPFARALLSRIYW